MNSPPRVLLVDDESSNLSAMKRVLRPLRYEVRTADDGQSALEDVDAFPPDLILLDVMMPGLSGFEVCRKLKSQPETASIPIVIVTGLSDLDSRITGLEAQADDFLSKPADPNEIRARVKSLLKSKSLYDELQIRHRQLRDLEGMRENLTHMIVHDLRNPLSVMKTYLSLMEDEWVDASEEVQTFVRAFETGTQTLLDMTTSMLDLAKLEAGELKLRRGEVNLSTMITDVVTGVQPQLVDGAHSIDVRLPEALPLLHVDGEIVRRTVVNILGNAINFSPHGGGIEIRAKVESDCVRVEVEDQGPGIPQEFQQRVFEKFGQIEGREVGVKYSTGLGLAFCKLAVEAHGGRIGVDSVVGHGSTFWFTIPVA